MQQADLESAMLKETDELADRIEKLCHEQDSRVIFAAMGEVGRRILFTFPDQVDRMGLIQIISHFMRLKHVDYKDMDINYNLKESTGN